MLFTKYLLLQFLIAFLQILLIVLLINKILSNKIDIFFIISIICLGNV